LHETETASRLRPLRRRRASTLRPPTVFIRARKPWVRFLFRLLGWKVLFKMTSWDDEASRMRSWLPKSWPRYRVRCTRSSPVPRSAARQDPAPWGLS
jgi:hypothetical protein